MGGLLLAAGLMAAPAAPAAAASPSSGPAPAQAPAAAAATYKVKIQLTAVDHMSPEIRVWNRTTWTSYPVTVPDGAAYGTADLPPGDYLTIGNHSDYTTEARFLPKTFSVVAAPTTVTLDSAAAKPAAVTVDDSTAGRALADAWFTLPNGEEVAFQGGSGKKLYVAPLPLPGLTFNLHDVLEKKGSTPNRPSPYRYDLFHRFTGGAPASPVVSVPAAGLARKHTTAYAQGAGVSASVWAAPSVDDGAFTGTYIPTNVPVAGAYTHYLTPGAPFERYLEWGSHALSMPGLELPAGDGGNESFGRGPFTNRPTEYPGSTYGAGKFTLNESESLSDAQGHAGHENGGTTYRVTGDSVLLGASAVMSPWDTFTVPAGTHSTYWINHTVTRSGAHSRVSPRVSTSWTFPGSALPAGSGGALPVLDPSFTVSGLDARNRVPAGPATVQAGLAPRAEGAKATVTGLAYSTDDGATWTAAALTGSGASRTATVPVPAGAAFVSLRIDGKDDKGGTVRQIVTRAFGGPGAQGALKVGATSVGGVVVNGGKDVVPALTGLGTFSAAFTATDPSGIGAAGIHLYHGPYDKPDGILAFGDADCVKRPTGSTYDCTADVNLSGAGHLGLNKLAGTWSVAAWAHAGDKKSLFSGPVPGSVAIKRSAALSVDATPEPVSAGAALKVTGRLTGSAWEYGGSTVLTGQKVELQFRKAGTTAWTALATATTDAKGTAVFTRTATVDGSWRMTYAGSGSATAVTSAADYVDVL
ncbi:hypothetical protein [Streptomyces sp. NPDC089799]|uniref:hypothetical protein n=1 Tax=Streptomyces sp. NPDC089799 TaxID=3155066 RepID=UPI0034436226